MLWRQTLAQAGGGGNVWEGRVLALLLWSQARVSVEILWIVMMTSVPYECHLGFIAVPSMYCGALSRSLPIHEFHYTLLISDHVASHCVTSYQNWNPSPSYANYLAVMLLVEVVSHWFCNQHSVKNTEQEYNTLQQMFSLWQQEFGIAQNLFLVSIRLKSSWATGTTHDNGYLKVYKVSCCGCIFFRCRETR